MPEQKDVPHENDIKVIKEWLDKQRHLPQNIDDRLIERFLHCCDFSLEQTKNLIDVSYTIRSQAPEIFSCRDLSSTSMQNILTITDMVPLPKVTNKNYKLFVYRLFDSDPDKLNYVDSVKTFLALSDVRLVSDAICDGEIPIFDLSGYSLRHAAKVSLPILKKFMIYTQEAHPVRLKQIHMVNVPPFLDKLLMLIKPLMKNEVAKLLHFHQPHSNTLYEHIPKELLPEEYGGYVGKLTDIKQDWLKKVMEYRSYILDESRWKVDESKRPIENKNGKQVFGIQGSFRSLSID